MKFVVATAFYSGLGFAIRLQEEGHEVVLAHGEPDDRRTASRYRLVGKGIVPKRPLHDVIARRSQYRDHIFVWDENHSVAENELLREQGYRVLGGGAHADRMEHDRDACVALVERYGLHPPPSRAFEDAASAVRFLEASRDTAYVFKPDRGETHETWIPPSSEPALANEELRQHLRSRRGRGSFLLQERKRGVEANIEAWFVRGEPRFAFLTLEAKRRLTGDLGDLAGCAFDFVREIPVDCRLMRETVGRLFPVYRELCFTGFGDANVIVADDGVWFLEKCERFGYNSHPNLLWNLDRAPLGETLASLVDGSFSPDFDGGFGASCTVYMDHPQPGKVVRVPKRAERHLYFMDVYKEGAQLLTAGYNELVVIANGAGPTMRDAWQRAVTRAWEVTFPGRAFRIDGDSTNYPSAPMLAYESLETNGFF